MSEGEDVNYKYRKLPVVIEAFQMTLARRSDNSEWPNWLHEAWNREPGENALVDAARWRQAMLDEIERLQAELEDLRTADATHRVLIAKEREEVERLKAEVIRLRGWLVKIDGADNPPGPTASVLRQWAYEAVTLGHEP
mgnify:CR=1 FL=1